MSGSEAPTASYSALRLKRDCVFGAAPGSTPGLMNTPMVTGMSPLWIRLSNTIVVLNAPLSLTNVLPSWNTIVQAGLSGLYCAGT